MTRTPDSGGPLDLSAFDDLDPGEDEIDDPTTGEHLCPDCGDLEEECRCEDGPAEERATAEVEWLTAERDHFRTCFASSLRGEQAAATAERNAAEARAVELRREVGRLSSHCYMLAGLAVLGWGLLWAVSEVGP